MGNSIQPPTIPDESSLDYTLGDPFSYVPLVPFSQSPTPTPFSESRKKTTSTAKSPFKNEAKAETSTAKTPPRKNKAKTQKAVKKEYLQSSIKKYLVKKTPVAGPSGIAVKGDMAAHNPLCKMNTKKRKASMLSNNTKEEKTTKSTKVLKRPVIGPLLPTESFPGRDVSDNDAKDVVKPEERPPRRSC